MQFAADRARSDSVLALTVATIAVLTALPARGQGCFSYPVGASETIAIELALGRTAMLEVELLTDAMGDSSCSAWIEVPLSSFPTSRLATRPADIARSMRDVVKKLGVKECDVFVRFENDTQEELADHELCLHERFEFGARKHWSLSSEGYCWEPDPNSEVELVEVD